MLETILIIQTLFIGTCYTQTLYEPNTAVLMIDWSNFDRLLLNSPTATIINFSAGWCGNCQRFAYRWKQIANNTKPWHDRVIRVASVDCALPRNEQICWDNYVVFYPKFAIYPPYSVSRVGSSVAYDLSRTTNEYTVSLMINFIENLQQRPQNYPVLQSYRSPYLYSIFDAHPNNTHILLVFEQADSLVGRKLIIDFSSVFDRLVIKHVVSTVNPALFDQLAVPRNTQPVVYLLTNIENQKNLQLLDTYMQKYKTNQSSRYQPWFDQRFKNAMQIIDLLKLDHLISSQEAQRLADSFEFVKFS